MVKDNSISSIILDVFIYIIMILVLVITLYPVLHVLASSFSGRIANEGGLVNIFPVDFTTEAYVMIWRAGTVPRAFLNSVRYTSVGVLIQMFITTTFAYAISHRGLPLRKFYTFFAIFTMYFSGGMIANFILINNLGLVNTMWALVLPPAMGITNMIIMRTFFMNLPSELIESARLDGAGDIKIFMIIVLPLSKAVLYTVGLFYMVGHWNSWFSAMIYLRDQSLFPLQLILRHIVVMAGNVNEAALTGVGGAHEGGEVNQIAIRFAIVFIAILPMLVIYPFIQRHFIKGVMIGSLKG
jgi:putative aldouronate transport system permease protein